jgi:hypothetical protein
LRKPLVGFAVLVALVGLTGCGSSGTSGTSGKPASTSQYDSRVETYSPSPNSDSGPSDSASSSSDVGGHSSYSSSTDAVYPHCADVWQVGKHLPADYKGACSTAHSTESDGGYDCADGSHVEIYDGVKPTLYAITAEPIKAMTNQEFVSYLVETCKPK